MVTTMTDTDCGIEEMRVLSKLSERYHVIREGGKSYACFAGIVLPLDLAQTVFLWVLVGAKYYARLLESRMDEIRLLNQDNQEMKSITDHGPMAFHLKSKLELVMRTWSPEQFEDVLPA